MSQAASSSALALLGSDLLALSKEAGRRNSDVRDAADKAYQLVKASPGREQTLAELHAEPPPNPQPLYQPIFLASATRNAKVIALAVSALQRLITAGAVPRGLVKQILQTLEQVIPQGVEIQLKVLQTLVSLLTSNTAGPVPERLVQGEELGQALELSHRLSTSKIPVVASTASASLRQLFMFVFERVQAEDQLPESALPAATFPLDVPTPIEGDEEGRATVNKSILLRPAARDAYLLLEDLCMLIAGAGGEGSQDGEPSFLRWGSLSRTFGLELVESIVSGFGAVVRSHPELTLVLRMHLCPLLIRFLSAPPTGSGSTSTFSFPLTLRLTRVVFLLLKQFSDLLPLESEIFLSIFVRVISPSDRGDAGEGGHPSISGGSCPPWMRVLALEIFRGLCGDFTLMMAFYERYDRKKGSSKVFSDLMMSFNRLATEKPAALGVGGAVLYGSSLNPVSSTISTGSSATGHTMIDSAFEMGLNLATAATSAVSASIPDGSLSVQTATLKLQCIDQLDKADAPAIPETYVFLLALQCLASLADGFASTALGSYASLVAQKGNGHVPGSLDLSVSPSEGTALDAASEARLAKLRTVRDMAEASWPALLASLSFFIATALDDDLFGDVVSALQNFTSVCGVLGLTTPREAFLTSLCKFAVPPSVVSHFGNASSTTAAPGGASSVLSASAESLGLSSAPPPIGLSSRNLACLRATISVAQYLAGSLGPIWFTIFETLQNAEFVLKSTSASRGRKKTASGVPQTPTKGSSTTTPLSPSKGDAVSSVPKAIPAVPTESDEQAVQNGISKLFEVSRALSDGAFKSFVGALCRLSGEMIGVPMSENGLPTPLPTTMASPAPPTPGGKRPSGISTMRTLRVDEKSFGISKLGVVSLLNPHRLMHRDASVAWDPITAHLLYVQHYFMSPPVIRLQSAEVLDQILVTLPKSFSTGDSELQKRGQTQVLVVLAAQAEPALRPQSSTDIEIRRMAFETLITILESNGHSFIAGWERIFHVLRTACPPVTASHTEISASDPASLGTIDEDGTHPSYFGIDKIVKNPVLVRTSFPSLQLICTDFLNVLTVDELRDCIRTLADFGRQIEDVNVALTAGGLLWGVSDHLQSKRKAGENEVAHGELWMFLLHQLLNLCQDSRQEARDGAITTIFRSISLYGVTLSKATWDACFWEIVFPLVDSISSTIATQNRTLSQAEGTVKREDLVPQLSGPPIRLLDKQWDDSKTLALRSMGNVFFEYLPRITKTSRYEETWAVFIAQMKRSFVEDRAPAATAAMQSLEKVLSGSLDGVDESRIASSWEVAWAAWDEIGHAVVSFSQPSSHQPAKTLTQINLEAFVKVALPIYTSTHITFDLSRIHRLLSVLKAVLTFTRSPDFRPDIDALAPLQAAVLEVLAAIRLELPGAASAVLSDLSEYMSLAFVAAFDSPGDGSVHSRSQRVSYIALAKEVMPKVLELFQRYQNDSSVYEQGAVERMFAAYALPLKLKHDCPAPSKFGADELLWKTATVNFLWAVRGCVNSLQSIGSALPTPTFEGIWRQIIEAYRGALLADFGHTTPSDHTALSEEENFDLALLISVEQDLLPHIGGQRVPDELLRRLGKCLQSASRLYDLDLPNRPTASLVDSSSSSGSISEQTHISETKETRFDPDFDRQAAGSMFGTTADVIEVARERFAYWCLELLFLLCTDDGQGNDSRKRIAALCLPMLLNRCSAVIKTYIADAPLRGKMPFPRIRQEELTFVLRKLLSSRLHDNALWASEQSDPTSSVFSPSTLDVHSPVAQLVRSALLRSPRGHLYTLHPLFTSLLHLSTTSPSIVSAYIPPHDCLVDGYHDGPRLKGLPDGFVVKAIGGRSEQNSRGDAVALVLTCLTEIGQEIGATL